MSGLRDRLGIPPMSAMKLQTLARSDADDLHESAPGGRSAAPVVGRKGLERVAQEVMAGQLAGHTTEILSRLLGNIENDVLETATRSISSAGYLERHYQVPYAGIAVINPSAVEVLVQEGGPGTGEQGDGPGSFQVPPGSFVCLPLVGRSITFFGLAGTEISYTVLTRRPPPSAGIVSGLTQSTARYSETSTLLAGGATINGTSRPTAGFSLFRAFAASDVAGTVNIQQSRDGTTWYTTVTQAVGAGITTGTVIESIVTLPFARAQYVNGAGAQGAFEFDSALVAV